MRPPTTRVSMAILAASLAVAAGGCLERPVKPSTTVSVRNGFPHAQHVQYFVSGQHRQEKVAMHVAAFGGGDAPEPITAGRCAECHDDLAAKPCGACHVLFQNAAVRERTAARPCVACHAATWTGGRSAVPRPEICRACHATDDPPGGPKLERVRFELAAPLRGPRVTTLPANVYFSHSAHVRFGRVACTSCHASAAPAAAPSPVVRHMPMIECLRCHRDTGASMDCLTCHR